MKSIRKLLFKGKMDFIDKRQQRTIIIKGLIEQSEIIVANVYTPPAVEYLLHKPNVVIKRNIPHKVMLESSSFPL